MFLKNLNTMKNSLVELFGKGVKVNLRKQYKGISFLLMAFLHFCNPTAQDDSAALILLLQASNNISGQSTCPPSSVPSQYLLANTIINAPGHNSSTAFKDANKSINGICGGGQNQGGIDVYTLDASGAGASLVLSWGGKTVINAVGIDFIVFENPFQYTSSANFFVEPIIVEVSQDNVNYCGFNPQYAGAASPASMIRADWVRLAGLTPVLWNMTTNPLSVSDIFLNASAEGYMGIAGGDGFNLDNLSNSNTFGTGCNATIANDIIANGFKYIRLVNAKTRAGFPAPQNSYDGGPDIDGVIAKQVSP
ncbi:LIC_13355 family lipoprotein [Leptospira yasudae]|nr:LIC_13355 family lipoprotein [Leptospira yasudae]